MIPYKINIPLGLPYDIVVRTAGEDRIITGVLGIEVPFADWNSAHNLLTALRGQISLLPDGPATVKGEVIDEDSGQQQRDIPVAAVPPAVVHSVLSRDETGGRGTDVCEQARDEGPRLDGGEVRLRDRPAGG